MNYDHSLHHNSINSLDILLALPFLIALIIYFIAWVISIRRHKQWALSRVVFWIGGVYSVVFAVIGPLSDRVHTDFVAHMSVHLLLGMLAPLLMVLGAPLTLLMRTLNVTLARRITKFLKSSPIRILSDPIITTLLNIGGLWILYTTDLYSLMHRNYILYLFIHLHIFISGYLFTLSFINVDFKPHKSRSYIYRSIVMVFAFAGHAILSKYIYFQAPTGVPTSQAEIGGMIMYYGGDFIDLLLIFILCYQWFKDTQPRTMVSRSQF